MSTSQSEAPTWLNGDEYTGFKQLSGVLHNLPERETYFKAVADYVRLLEEGPEKFGLKGNPTLKSFLPQLTHFGHLYILPSGQRTILANSLHRIFCADGHPTENDEPIENGEPTKDDQPTEDDQPPEDGETHTTDTQGRDDDQNPDVEAWSDARTFGGLLTPPG